MYSIQHASLIFNMYFYSILCANNYHLPRIICSAISANIGAAFLPPPFPFSINTAIAYLGCTLGKYPANHACTTFSPFIYCPVSALPVLPAEPPYSESLAFTPVLMMLENRAIKRQLMFMKIMKEISRNVIPIRPGRTNIRRAGKKTNKFPMNQKRSL